MVIHHGTGIPAFPKYWDPSDKEWVWFCWDDLLDGASISSSDFTLPDGWTEHQTLQAQTVNDDGTTFDNCNGVLTSNPNAGLGHVVIANRITLSDQREYERSVTVRVMEQ